MPQRHYTQLSQKERDELEGFLKLDKVPSQIEMAKAIGCHQSTISRELRRNNTPEFNKTIRVNGSNIAKLDGRHCRGRAIVDVIYKKRNNFKQRSLSFKQNKSHYDASRAQQFRDERIKLAKQDSNPKLLFCRENVFLREMIIRCLKINWSPEQIRYRIDILNLLLVLSGSPPLLPIISIRAIYDFIYTYTDEDLTKYLRRKGRKYRYKSATKFNQTDISKNSIHDRPAIIDELGRYGDMEGDTIVGADKKDRLLTHVERLSGVGSISLIFGFNADKISKSTESDMNRVFYGMALSITYDHGIEFSSWRVTEARLSTDIFFADAYKSCQRGRNENFNGLVREYLPKGTDFKKLTKNDILRIESLINNRPRKRLCGLTPLEVQEILMFYAVRE